MSTESDVTLVPGADGVSAAVQVDGRVLSSSATITTKGHWILALTSEADALVVASKPLKQLFAVFDCVQFPNRTLAGGVLHLSYCDNRDKEAGPFIFFGYDGAQHEWKGLFSIADVGAATDAVATERAAAGHPVIMREDDHRLPAIHFSVNVGTETLGGTWESLAPMAESIVDEAIIYLHRSLRPEAVLTAFRFPPEITIAAEQYLRYFVQFLADIGIRAKVDIEHEAHQILFSVVPADGNAALETVRHALDVYLSLPGSSPAKHLLATGGDVAVIQLRANILHLESQVALAEAVLQAKNATIEALQLSNYRYREIVGQVRFPTTAAGTQDTDKEDVIRGVVSVTEYEGKGFTVNLAEMVRRLKRRFD